ncbi:hypothetical protein MMC06_006134 [Schaereria dolodes]|nr:hypothetical protein [Schaereria dolodes]
MHFTPRNRTISRKNLSLSTPKTRQQTLTQIDFVSRSAQDMEDVDLAYEDDTIFQISKRQKTVSRAATPSNVQTRASKWRISEQHDADGRKDAGEKGPERPLMSDAPLQMVNGAAPLPTTPRRIQKLEVPSSQSPADTPLSTQSPHSVREISKSPLKERSINSRMHRGTVRDSNQKRLWKPKLEIQDTFKNENKDKRIFMPPKVVKPQHPGVIDKSLRSAQIPHTSVISKSSSTRTITRRKRVARSPLDQKFKTIKTEAQGLNSESEHEIGQDDDFAMGMETQRAFVHTATSVDDFENGEERMCAEGRFRSAHENPDDLIAAEEPETTTTGIPVKLNLRVSGATQTPDITNCENSESNVSSLNMKSKEGIDIPEELQPMTPNMHRSESEEASAQLANDLYRLTQPCVLIETESQFQDGWRDYSVKDLELEEEIEEIEPKSEPQSIHSLTFEADSNCLPLPLPTLPSIVPPSQATTVDITQPSPRVHTVPTQLLSKSRPQSRFPRPVTPPLLSPFSSSPLETRTTADGIGGYGYEGYKAWDGKPLTESQLLPDSLLNDTMVGPPPLPWTQESLED